MKSKSIKEHTTDETRIILDKSLPRINVVTQDVGWVLLNLINNAYYAGPLPPLNRVIKIQITNINR